MKASEILAQVRQIAGEEVSKAVERMQERRNEAQTEARSLFDADTTKLMAEQRKHLKMVFGGVVLAIAMGKSHDGALAYSKGALTSAFQKNVAGEVTKILEAGTAINGGVLIAPQYSDQIIDLLVPNTVVRKHVTDSVDVSSGSMTMSRMTADASSSWGGETTPIQASQGSFDELTLRAFQHKILVPISNTLLQRGGPRVANTIQMSTLRAMGLGEDLVFLTSPGSEYRPKGLRHWAPSANRLAAQAFSGSSAEKLTKVTEDLSSIILAQEEANVPGTGNFWAFAPRTKQYLMSVRDGNGNFVYRPEMLLGSLWGFPFETTTRISTTEGDDADESYIYFTDGDEIMLGQGSGMQIVLSTEGTYVDGSGNVISAIQRNLTLLRVINEVDLKPKHVEAVVTMSGVKWAPTA